MLSIHREKGHQCLVHTTLREPVFGFVVLTSEPRIGGMHEKRTKDSSKTEVTMKINYFHLDPFYHDLDQFIFIWILYLYL